ncbi:C-type lectin domain family 4 member G-like [Dreissena polymorpha]|uniref:C-type lectin domain-containing protein n=1 Tax=Dreissena polymorpha TaxID=45954 RepID=A0A9D4LHW8_DREPO|nr:C-type lectin domain family 4 member G-like [Dreissena polymorpha]KAH3858355.1 hypothetical protein DPMN_100978 [Dreissena polymorpha]
MACVLNLFVLSLTLLATLSVGSRQFDVLDKKINAVHDIMEVKIEMIKEDLAMVVKNLNMSAVGEIQGTNGNVSTIQIANTMVENMKNSIQAAEDFYKVIHRGFISEKMALRKSISRIEQSMTNLQHKLENVNGDLTSKFQLLNAEINKNKDDIEKRVEKAKQYAILKSNEDCKISNIKFNGELSLLQSNFMKIVNDVKKDLADIRVISINQLTFTRHTYDNSIYFELNSTMNFSEGSRRCRQYGAHLPEVTTSGENSFLRNTFVGSRRGIRIFLGATDQLIEGHWIWEYTGQEVRYQDWNTGEPNNENGGEDCLEISYWNVRWNDARCTTNMTIVCEFNI